jgi:hypothetical protein
MSDDFRLLRPEDGPILSEVTEIPSGCNVAGAILPDGVTLMVDVPGRSGGYFIGISNYRIRHSHDPVFRDEFGEPMLTPPFLVISKAFPPMDAAMLGLCMAVEFRANLAEADLSPEQRAEDDSFWKGVAERHSHEWVDELLSPPVRQVAFSYLALFMRDKCDYKIERCPWPGAAAPRQVVRLTHGGVEPQEESSLAVAFGQDGDAWVVTRFSCCGVEKAGPPASLSSEQFLQLLNMASDTKSTLGPSSAIAEAIVREICELRKGNAAILQHLVAMRPHVEGVPPLVERATEALAEPLAAADEARRQMPLSREEHEIRDAVAKHGTQKTAAEALGMSEATVSRRMAEIRRKMKDAGFPEPIVFRPSSSYRQHVRSPDRAGMDDEVDIEVPALDWRDDPVAMEGMVRFYVSPNRSETERAEMRQAYPDIEAEGEEFRRRGTE